MLLALMCAVRRVRYVSIVVADAEACWTSAMGNARAWRLIGRLVKRLVAWLVRRSAGVIYVTEGSLQRAYPVACGTPTLVRSNVRIDPSELHSKSRGFPAGRRLVAIGSQQSLIKGHDVAIRALQLLRRMDDRYHLTLIGDGKFQTKLRQLAINQGVGDAVSFRGRVDRSEVLRELEEADLLLMPSRTEGLPRALIEGMAIGLPAVGSAVGGIPELLPSNCCVPPDDPAALARGVHDLFNRPDDWLAHSRRNNARAAAIAESTRLEHLQSFLLDQVLAG